jgi:hypothetical protein
LSSILFILDIKYFIFKLKYVLYLFFLDYIKYIYIVNMGIENKYDIPQQQVKPFPAGAGSPREAGIVQMQANSQMQHANNQALAGGRKNKRGGGSMTIQPLRLSYTETAAGPSSVNSQMKTNVTNDVQNQENRSMDAGAFKKGGKRRNK